MNPSAIRPGLLILDPPTGQVVRVSAVKTELGITTVTYHPGVQALLGHVFREGDSVVSFSESTNRALADDGFYEVMRTRKMLT